MGIKLEVNGRQIDAEEGETILSALNRNGLQVPTICSMKDLSPTGACRMCVVEVEGRENLVPSCSFPVEEALKITTHSPRVLKARKTNVELLLSNHPDDCLYCERNGSCELQSLAEHLNIRERRMPGKKSPYKIDRSSPAIIRDPAKCILCGRCVRICEEQMATSTLDFAYRGNELRISTTLGKPLNFSNCTACGQCLLACPTGALIEHVQFPELDSLLHAPEKLVIAQYTPAVAVSLAEMLGIKAGSNMSDLIRLILHRCGFDHVVESAVGADVMIMEQVAVFHERKREGSILPLITSSCPAWVQYVEQYYPELIPALSPLKSPQLICGSLIKKWLPRELQEGEKEIVSVLISSCTAAKNEARRVEMTHSGVAVIDYVITTRELARLVRLSGLDLGYLEEMKQEMPFHLKGSAGNLTGVAGGEAEATCRTLYRQLAGKEMVASNLHRFRINKPYREMSIRAGKHDLRIASVSGLSHIQELMAEIKAGKRSLDLLEVMACPGGCTNGGGQPLPVQEGILRTRSKAVYDMDNSAVIQEAHNNPVVKNIYDDLLATAGSETSRDMFHTTFAKRDVLL